MKKYITTALNDKRTVTLTRSIVKYSCGFASEKFIRSRVDHRKTMTYIDAETNANKSFESRTVYEAACTFAVSPYSGTAYVQPNRKPRLHGESVISGQVSRSFPSSEYWPAISIMNCLYPTSEREPWSRTIFTTIERS